MEWKKQCSGGKEIKKKGCQYKCPTSFTNKHFQVETRAIERQANIEREREREEKKKKKKKF